LFIVTLTTCARCAAYKLMSHPADPPSVISLRQSHCSLWFQHRKVLTTLALVSSPDSFFALVLAAPEWRKVVWARDRDYFSMHETRHFFWRVN